MRKIKKMGDWWKTAQKKPETVRTPIVYIYLIPSSIRAAASFDVPLRIEMAKEGSFIFLFAGEVTLEAFYGGMQFKIPETLTFDISENGIIFCFIQFYIAGVSEPQYFVYEEVTGHHVVAGSSLSINP